MLWVVMPVYNEEASVGKVFEEWLPVLRSTVGEFRFLALNDGSKDRTQNVLTQYAAENSEISVIEKKNSGHGHTCLYGYREAIRNGAEWVLQIDSDGQCDASFFPQFWRSRGEGPAVFGYRDKREDGLARTLISRIVSLVVFFSTLRLVRDPNVPYRLIRSDLLETVIDAIPQDFYLSNILISARIKARTRVLWLPITFRERFGGTPSIKTFSFVKEGVRLFVLLCRETLSGRV
jgi:dolichol-phosphate mannosyltransferase